MLTPEEIKGREFLVSLRGYDRDEVKAFLAEVATAFARVHERVAELARAAAQTPAAASASVAPEAAGPTSELFAQIGRETQRILEAAEEAGEQIRLQAKADVEKELHKARNDAARLIADGERRREAIEKTVTELERVRDRLAADLRTLGRGLEQMLRTLAPAPRPTTTVREALSETASPPPEVGTAEEPAPEAAAESEPEAVPEPAPENDEAQEGADEPAAAADAEGTTEPVPETGRDLPQRPAMAATAEPRITTPNGPPGAGERAARVNGPVALAQAPKPSATRPGGVDGGSLRSYALASLQPHLVRRLKRSLQDLENITLDKLRRSNGEQDAADLLPSVEEVHEVLAGSATLLEDAYRAGVMAAPEIAGRPLRAPVEQRLLRTEFEEHTATRIQGALAASLRVAFDVGEDLSALTDRVGRVFMELRATVAGELATEELVRAYELGLLDAWAAGGITHRRWVLGEEPRCPEGRCRHNGVSGSVAIDEPFPSGHNTPPVHAGCTCTTTPELEPH